MAETTTVALVTSHIRESLGQNVIDVELTTEQIKAAIRSGVNVLNRFKPLRRFDVLPMQVAGRCYIAEDTQVKLADETLDISELTPLKILPGFQTILNVEGISNLTSQSGNKIDLFDPLIYINGSAASSGSLSSYLQTKQTLKGARDLFGAGIGWRGTREPVRLNNGKHLPVYTLYISIPASVNFMTYGMEYAVSITPDDDAKTGISYIASSEQDWFYRFCLAEAKITLGLIRRKFQGIPSPDGGDMALDGLELQTDGETEKADLLAQIKSMSATLGPIIM